MIPQDLPLAEQQVVTILKCLKGRKGIVVLKSCRVTKYLGCFRKRSGFLGDDSCIENAGTKRRKLRKRVTRDKEEEDNEENLDHKEILDDMGLNILSDNSNSCDTMQHPHNSRSQVSIVQNIIVLLFRTDWSLETSLF